MNESTTFLLVRISVLLVVLVVQFLAWKSFRTRFDQWPIGRSTLAGLFFAMNLPGIYIVFFAFYPVPGWLLSPVIWIYVLWQAGCLVRVSVTKFLRVMKSSLKDQQRVSTVPSTPHQDVQPSVADESRRTFLRESIAGIALLGVGSIVPNPLETDDYEVVHQTIQLPNLSPRHQGLTIGIISDIHSGPYMHPDELVVYFDALKKLKPDIILLPGDFVQNKNEEVGPVCEIVKTLHAPYGIYGCTGNHEYFADAEYIARELELAGVIMLRNQHRIITPAGEKLAIIGINDVRTGHPFDYLLAKAVKGLDRSVPNMLLCHKPYYFDEAAEWGINLMISGHTHGGQIVLARVFNTVITPAALISGYIAGHYTKDSSQLYVTRGIGTVGLPFRFNCPPEITLLKLTA